MKKILLNDYVLSSSIMIILKHSHSFLCEKKTTFFIL